MKLENNPFEEGDRIKVRGYEYIVKNVPTLPHDGDIIQWELSRCDPSGPTAILDIVDDQLVLKEFREVDEEDVEVVE